MSAPDRMFPVLLSLKERMTFPDCPSEVSWDAVKPHEAQAEANHDQTLEVLARRGGLHPVELWCVVKDMPYRYIKTDDAIALAQGLRGCVP